MRSSCISRGDRVCFDFNSEVLMVNLSLMRLDVDEDDMMDEESDMMDLVENILIVG